MKMVIYDNRGNRVITHLEHQLIFSRNLYLQPSNIILGLQLR